MEVNLKKLGEQEIESTATSKKFRLSDDSASMVFQMFTKLIYSNPIGTVVREITSNCFDSHVEAKINAPVLIKKFKDNEDGTNYISFIDFGVGMSPDRIENVYGVYFESTKRVDNTQIGGFGIGGKTPLAYKRKTGLGEKEYDNSFQVITIYNGVKYSYLVFEGNEAPEISEPDMVATTEHNGTEIRIPVLEKDLEAFAKEMVRQLYYFENIVFEGFENDYRNGETLTNEYQIVRGKSFLFRGDEYSEYMHVCLGKVAYPIDYNILNLSSSDYRLPVAVKLEIGDIGVNLSREQLDYSEETIKLLKKKLEVVKVEMKELITKQYTNVRTLEDYFNVKSNFGRLEFSNGSSINVGNLIKQADVDFSNFAYSFLKMPNDKQLFKFFFDVNSYGKKPKKSRYGSSYEFEGGYKELEGKTNLLYITGEFNRKVVKQAYLKQQHELYHIIDNRNLADNSMRHEIAELFNVHVDKTCDDNGKPTAYVQSLIDMQEEYFTIVQRHAVDYDAVVIPDDFVASRKRGSGITKELRNTTIPVHFEGGYSKHRVKLDILFNYNSPIFYGTAEDESKLKNAYQLFTTLFDSQMVVSYYSEYDNTLNQNSRRSAPKSKGSIMFIQLAVGNIKYMEFCKKAYHVNEFFKRILYRKEDMVKNYFQSYQLYQKYTQLGDMYRDENFSKVSPVWGAEIKEVNKYFNAIPEQAKDDSIGRFKYLLEKYFDLSVTGMTKQQEAIAKKIEDIMDLKKLNEPVLRWINMPYEIERANTELINILKKVMVL